MISEGTVAPSFELPALVDGERRRVALGEYVGEDVVILAFYPADFNPACDGESCDLDELDLFTMQKDVTILGISPDSVYSHRAFADQYSLNVPLLSDTAHEVAGEYGIDFVDDIGQQLIERGVVVIDHDGVVQYAWSTADLTELPAVGPIKDAIGATGGDDTAFARYRVGYAHYTEGRRAFTSAMNAYQDSEWMMAQGDFQQAREEFAEAEDRFDTALRFVDDDGQGAIYEGAKTKANALWQAADWLAESASDYSSGSGAAGQEWREDAERPLETARDYEEPPDPDDWPPQTDDLEKDESEKQSLLPQSEEPEDAALDVDIDAEVESTAEDDGVESGDIDDAPAATTAQRGPSAGSETAAETDDAIDDAELEEIQAELEATHPDSEPSPEEITEEPTAMVEAPPDSVAGDTDEALADIQAEVAASEAGTTDDGVPAESTAMVDAPPGTEPQHEEAEADAVDDAGAEGVDDSPAASGDDATATVPGDTDSPDRAADDTTADDATEPDDDPGEFDGDVTPDDEFGGYVTPETGPVGGNDDAADESETED